MIVGTNGLDTPVSVVVPDTVPWALSGPLGTAIHVPDTELPVWVSIMSVLVVVLEPSDCVN